MPAYLELYQSGELNRRIDAVRDIMQRCTLCPWQCRVNRLAGETGYCRIGAEAVVSSYGPHFGEERPISGYRGSGTIFLTGCNLRCVYCQNYDISHLGEGFTLSAHKLADVMTMLWQQGCHNLNFVTPTHQIFQILEALPHAIERGVDIPLVYNCGGYESVDTLKRLEGIFDIYMPDIKYGENAVAQRLSGPGDYVERSRAALKEMQRQVGTLAVNSGGIAVRGLLVRHLILPDGLAGTASILKFIANELSQQTSINLMDQYRPCFEADRHPSLDRRITRLEYKEARELARQAGLKNLL